MLGLGRNGLRKIAGRRALSSTVSQTTSSAAAPPPHQQQPAAEGRRSFTKPANRPFVPSTSAEQLKLQKKYQEKLNKNEFSTLHDAVEYVEWRGTVFPQTMTKIVALLQQSSDLSALSDRQMAVLLSVFGSTCDTVSRSIRAEHLDKVEAVLREKGVVLGLLARNKLIEVKIDNRTKVDAVEELGKFDEAGIELDGTAYALLCEVYAKEANTKAITDIIAHMKASGIALTEDHVAQLVYSVARGGNYSQVGRVVDTFATSMNVVRLRCAAARAIAEREKLENGRGGFEVTEMLRAIPTTAKMHTLDNNVYVLNVLMDLVENGQLDAFNLLSSYLQVAESGNTLPDNKNNLKLVARAKSLLSEGNVEGAVALYSCAHPSYSNDYFLQKLQQRFEEDLKTLTPESLQSYLKTLTLAEKKGLLPNTNEFLLNSCAKPTAPAFLLIFNHVYASGDLAQVIEKNPQLKRPLGRHLAHHIRLTTSPGEKASLLAKLVALLFVPSAVEQPLGAYGFYRIIYEVANKDVKLVLPAMELIPDEMFHQKKEFATAIVHQLLFNANKDHLVPEKLRALLESDKIEQLNTFRLHGVLHSFMCTDDQKSRALRLKKVAKILALDFGKRNNQKPSHFAGRNLVKFLSNETISLDTMTQLIPMLENEQRVSLSTDEIAEAQKTMAPEKAELVARLKKSATMQRWRSQDINELLKEHDNLKEGTKLGVKLTLRSVIVEKAIREANRRDLDFVVSLLERCVEWREIPEGEEQHAKQESLKASAKLLEEIALSRAVVANDSVLADRIWQMRSPQAAAANVLLSYASFLFLKGEVARADEVCEVLQKSSQTIRPQTLEKMGRRIKGVDTEKMTQLAAYLGEKFNLREADTRRVILQAKTDQLQALIEKNDIAGALRMAVEETHSSGRAFGQLPLMIEAISRNDRQTLESVHTMVRTAHSTESANLNLAYALIHANHVKRAKELVERQNLSVDDRQLQYFTTVASSKNEPRLLKDLFVVFNGRASTLELNKLLELATMRIYRTNDVKSLEELSREIESTSFPLQNKLRTFFEDFNQKQSERVDFD